MQIWWKGKSAVQGTGAFEEKGDTISRRILHTQFLKTFIKKLLIWILIDGLASRVFLKGFACCWNLKVYTIHVDPHITFIAKQYLHHNVWLAERSHAPALWCITTYDLLRALMQLHCDIMIRTKDIKTWCSRRSFKANLPCLQKKIQHQKHHVNITKSTLI